MHELHAGHSMPDTACVPRPHPASDAAPQGSCGYGYLDQSAATGWNIAALTDACDLFNSGGAVCG